MPDPIISKRPIRNFAWIFVVSFLAFQTETHAQNINLPADSVTKLLCKKWEIDYVLLQGNKVDLPSSTPKVYVEFYKDGTFALEGGEPNIIEKGTWMYDASKGTASMLVKGQGSKEIISLTKDQFAIFSDDPASVPKDPQKTPLKTEIHFKVKQE